jgi:hypothetical protein
VEDDGTLFDFESDNQGGELVRPTADSTSPFDALRREDEHGEHWSGRDLQPVMDYLRWHEFDVMVAKAKASLALVQGQEAADHHFVDRHSDGGRWGNQQLDDYRLTRFGAYLTAMAGDGNKKAVAEARVYFAVRARQAEVAEQSNATLDSSTPEGALALAEVIRGQALARIADAKVIASQAKVIKKLKTAAEMLKTYTGAQGWVAKREFARDVQQGALDLGITLTQQEIFDFLGFAGLIIRTAGHEFDQATATAIKERKAKNVTITIPHDDGTVEKKKYGKLSAKGEAYAWNRIFTALDQHGTLDLDVIRGAVAPVGR